MASGLLGVGLSGLLAAQRSLTVTGNNISNANTDGYSRQRVDLSPRPPQLYGSRYVGDRFAELGQQSNTSLKVSVGQIYALASGIAELNQIIITAIGAASGGLPNDLLDKRDAALTQLSKLVSVTAVPQSDGSMN